MWLYGTYIALIIRVNNNYKFKYQFYYEKKNFIYDVGPRGSYVFWM